MKSEGKIISIAERRRRRKLGFMAGILSLITPFIASSAPIPLYSIYRQEINLSQADLSIATVTYFLGTMLSLLMFARLSNYRGRRPIIFVTLGLAVVGCLMFVFLKNAQMLMVGRLVQGLSCGLASSTLTTYIIEMGAKSSPFIGPAAASGSPLIGLALGAFGAGIIKEFGSGSLAAIYWIVIAILIICIGMIGFSPESVKAKKGALKSIIPQIRVPRNIRGILPSASAVFIGTWAIGGFYQAFSATITADYLQTDNTLVAAAVFASLMAPNVIGGMLVSRFNLKNAQRLGMLAFLIAFMGILLAIYLGLLGLFLTVSIIAGVAHGLAFTSSMRRILDISSEKDRAGVLSTIYLISYSGAAIPNLIVGRIGHLFAVYQIAVGYGILVGIMTLIVLVTIGLGQERIRVN